MGFLSHPKAVVVLLMILVFSTLAATEKKAGTKKERRTRADEVEEITEEKGSGKAIKAGKEVKEEAALDSTEKNEEDDHRVQEDEEKTKSGTITAVEEETEEDPEQEATEKTKKTKEERENTEINGERDERVRELAEEELEAVLKKNCSLVNLDDEDGSSGSEVAEYPCKVALWFQGTLPKWIKTFNFRKDVEALSRKELDEAAEAVCECKIIDISDFCSARVRVAAQKIIDRCPRNTVVTRLFRQAESHFGPHDVGKEEVLSEQMDLL